MQPLYIQKQTTPSQAPGEFEQRRKTRLRGVPDSDDSDEEVEKIKLNRSDGLVIIPEGYGICQTQPKQGVEIDYSKTEAEFNTSVNLTFGFQQIKGDETEKQIETQNEVILTVVGSWTAQIEAALAEIYMHIYPETKKVVFSIPRRNREMSKTAKKIKQDEKPEEMENSEKE